MQMARLPTWLSGRGIDELDGANEEEYKICYDRLVDIIHEEESAHGSSHDYSQTLRDVWDSGQLWYIHALDSVNAFPAVFEQHLRPRFFKEFSVKTDGRVLSQLWDEDVMDFIDAKVRDFDKYQERIREIFAEAKAREMR
jgi:DNA-binding ferritin-like protein (Dps family)